MPQTRQHMRRDTGSQFPPYGKTADHGVCVTPEGIACYLDICRGSGRTEGTLQWYSRGLKRLYQDLPEDKIIRRGTLEHWREDLAERGYAAGTINSFLSVGNAYLDFVGHREYQLANQLKLETELQPELTRAEYLRLLRAARSLGQDRAYLLVKLFGTTGLTVQELHRVTAEAVKEGKLNCANRDGRAVPIPEGLRKELLGYAERNGCRSGPLFLTKEGTPMSRTYVTAVIRRLCTAAGVAEEKGNPRCLKRLYQSTRSGIEGTITLLVDQVHNRLLEQEQLEIGWDEA